MIGFFRKIRNLRANIQSTYLMQPIKTILSLAVLLCCAVSSVWAAGIHKWVDESGITHYSDMAPVADVDQVAVIEVSSAYSTNNNVEQDYYSITNQWMRIHQERLDREKIKLEKAKQKAVQQPVAPQVVYVNEPNKDRYRVSYPFFIRKKFKHHDDFSSRRRNFCPDDLRIQRHGFNHRNSGINTGLTLKIQ